MQSLKKDQNLWNFAPLFKGDNDPLMKTKREIMKKKSYEFIQKWKNRSDYLIDPSVLRNALDEYVKWSSMYAYGADEMYYFELRTSQDENDPKLKAKFNGIEEFSLKIQNDIQFFLLNVAKIEPKLQGKFLNSPLLVEYHHFLEKLFAESSHLLSDKEEKILNLKSTPAYDNWVKLTSGFLSKSQGTVTEPSGKKVTKNFSELIGLLENKNKQTRDSAAVSFNKILHTYSEVAEVELNSILTNKKIDDELRKFDRPDSSRHLSDDIDTKTVDTVIKVVSDNFDISKRFYELKTKLLGLKKLKYHERNIPYGDIEKKYTYSDSVKFAGEVFKNLDEEFFRIFENFVNNGHVDVFPRKGKRSGAFCAHYLISEPTYILLNHTDKLTDVLTLAHEMGHGINNELVRKSQNALNFGTPTSTAEVASTFMEDFVLEELLKGADDKLRLAILIKKLNDDISSIFRQVAVYQFELSLHGEFRRKGYLSKEDIGSLFTKHMTSYMGEAVEQSPGSENWWIYWNHIRYFFYVYSYASGLLISKSLQRSVRRDKVYIHKVKQFLSAGRSKSPKEIFLELGIDITKKSFWEKGVSEIEATLQEAESLARKLHLIS